MSRRRRLAHAGLAVAVVLAVVGTVTAVALWRQSDPADVASVDPSVATATVVRRTLTSELSVTGNLTYGRPMTLAATSPGTVTWVAEPGAVIERGETLLRVDNQPVLLLYGKVPMYRDMVRGTKGDDVAQLRANLKELGVTNSEGGNVYTSATAAAVRRWQRDLGLPPTGVVERGRVWFAPGVIRVAQIRAQPGAAAGGEVLTYTGVHKQVDLTLTLDRSDWARVGTEVRVVLPDGGEAAGAVANVEVATTSTDAGEREVVHVTVAVADQEALASFDVVRVEVRYVTQERRDVLTVPVTALLALAEGGYGLEVVAGSTTRLIPVEVGLIADALVEVRGPDLAEGMRVRLPQ